MFAEKPPAALVSHDLPVRRLLSLWLPARAGACTRVPPTPCAAAAVGAERRARRLGPEPRGGAVRAARVAAPTGCLPRGGCLARRERGAFGVRRRQARLSAALPSCSLCARYFGAAVALRSQPPSPSSSLPPPSWPCICALGTPAPVAARSPAAPAPAASASPPVARLSCTCLASSSRAWRVVTCGTASASPAVLQSAPSSS